MKTLKKYSLEIKLEKKEMKQIVGGGGLTDALTTVAKDTAEAAGDSLVQQDINNFIEDVIKTF